MELDILKSHWYFHTAGSATHSMTYQFILERPVQYSVVNECRVLEVSRAGYDAWCKHEVPRRQRENGELLTRSRAIYAKYHGR